MYKYFKRVDDCGENGVYNDFFFCDKEVEIPTAKELREWKNGHSACDDMDIVEITKEEFVQGVQELFAEIVMESNDLVAWTDDKVCKFWEYYNPNDED